MKLVILNGTNFVVSISAEPIGGMHLTEMDLKLVFYTGLSPKLKDGEVILTNRSQCVTPNDMVKVDLDTYLALVKSEITGPGNIMLNVYASFTDPLWEDNRKEYVQLPTNLFTV